MPPKAASNASGINATENEIKLALAILKLVPRPTSAAAYAKIAEDAGFASGDSVRHMVRKAAEKHDWFSLVTEELAAAPRPKKAATPRKKKIAEAAEEDAEEEGTPTMKRARKGKGNDAAAAGSEEQVNGQI
ncbi:uncharacterized protein ColSpa_03718 [Colletotrichum spaethianum]|uniref:Uncharacterized protein n=1 Tax=Colletotrichum spaethianum TaxID=700344 RepID=A0AA37NVR3_9PEZI|nr:uncharacterized protein ColSpa_03718 [Colletotrichum spaethianum]GKT43537.1 hypothetical protein ColSpa_03718 [Colletotrichum spaethianum]